MKKIKYCIAIILLFTLTNAQSFNNNLVLNPKLVPLEVKVGQMLLVGFSGDTYNKEIDEYLKQYYVGGVILFNKTISYTRKPNIISSKQLKNLTQDLQHNAYHKLFIAVDMEGGSVARLNSENGFKDFKSAYQLGLLGTKASYNQALEIGSILAQHGINVNFSPVVDVIVDDNNPIISLLERSFSKDYKEVVEHANATISGLHKNNIITSIKHFPGHGSSSVDSHIGFVDITNTYNQNELEVYKDLIKIGYKDMIMTAHVFNGNIDSNYPASLSKIFNTKILRKELDYKGVIITDDLKMGAIEKNWSFEDTIILAINSGADILMYGNNIGNYNKNFVKDATNIIISAVNDGRISIKTIDEAYLRIIVLKKQYLYGKR